ncbi:thiamine pyrophosphate-dependent dehydrogenase E1 component subunit alpha [Azospirillum lipoferum]|uniref:Pyruvate dehydrogenase E1 component,alpha subunit n=1 Tax=Azospirillum lipoferum (strain 4B) TaxID=862719 RepID=G7ZIX6_AZOL4|nr:thiamine pyrophosphate-dependent dehydrogenase E1 component subunit alpha [Azospirillum lipoferum]CBS91463.1 putative pyruvate dehydrogenase E1 component,alpha subunit [Azospirillum lipoferum 4B]
MTSQYTPETIARLYRSLYFIRHYEERVAAIYPSDRIKSPVHLSIGQEFISVGVCDVLRPDDAVSGTYRGHAAYLAKGGDPAAMMAEMYGKATGSAAGRGGSMHLIDTKANVLGASAVVGTTIPIAAGYALALKRQKTDRVVVAFFGDGASEEGCFYETLNFAALHKLPILFVCENNFYAIHEPQSKRWATDRFCERVATFGIDARKITSGDLFEVRDTAAELVDKLRRGEGPALIECHAYRWREHVGPNEDYDQGYRPRTEMEPWEARDEVPRIAALLPEAERAAIEAEAQAAIDAAVAFAEQSPFPAAEELYRHVFA